MMPDGTRMATLHLSISDADGDNAIFEYIGGELKIHHDKSYQVMTNSPVFDQQLALNDYWKISGERHSYQEPTVLPTVCQSLFLY